MDPIVVTTIICPGCVEELEPVAEVCPRCGSPTRGTVQRAVAAEADPGLQSLIDNRKLLLLLLFTVTAATGLPFLWRSRSFSPWGKMVLTVLVCLYTVLILWIFWLVCSWCIGSIRGTLGW